MIDMTTHKITDQITDQITHDDVSLTQFTFSTIKMCLFPNKSMRATAFLFPNKSMRAIARQSVCVQCLMTADWSCQL